MKPMITARTIPAITITAKVPAWLAISTKKFPPTSIPASARSCPPYTAVYPSAIIDPPENNTQLNNKNLSVSMANDKKFKIINKTQII